jgi:hypothetical protein
MTSRRDKERKCYATIASPDESCRRHVTKTAIVKIDQYDSVLVKATLDDAISEVSDSDTMNVLAECVLICMRTLLAPKLNAFVPAADDDDDDDVVHLVTSAVVHRETRL